MKDFFSKFLTLTGCIQVINSERRIKSSCWQV